MKKQNMGIVLVIFCTFLTSIGQIYLKTGASTLSFDVLQILTNYKLIIGCLFYGLGAIVMIIALKFGELSVIYPLISLSFIWVSLGSIFFLGESFNINKLIGVFSIISGVGMIGIGDKK